MKQDPYFKYLVIIVLAGLVTALVDPTPAVSVQTVEAPAVAASASHLQKTKG